MSGIDIAENQPESFAFTPENEAKADAIISKYPEGRHFPTGFRLNIV